MKKIVQNKDNLKEEDVTEVVKRVKVLLINSKSEILLGYSHNVYQFPGGHVEKDESLNDALIREVKEETGITLKGKYEPFVLLTGYFKDWPEKGMVRKIEIYYYEVFSDEHYNLELTSYTESELKGNFELRYISLDNVEEELKKDIELYGDNKGIERDMLEVIKIYKEGKTC